jgi:DNA-binding MarR family transcriptional regulator
MSDGDLVQETAWPVLTAPLPGQALNDVSRLLRRRFQQQLKLQRMSLTHPQARVIMSLARLEGINQATLAQTLEMEPITLVRVIDRLEGAKLVERSRDPQDRRAWIIHLTPQARPLVREIVRIGGEVWAEAVSGLGQGDRDLMQSVLNHIKGNLLASLARGPSEDEETANG